MKSWCAQKSSRNVKNQRGLPGACTTDISDQNSKQEKFKLHISECFDFLNFSEQTKTHSS